MVKKIIFCLLFFSTPVVFGGSSFRVNGGYLPGMMIDWGGTVASVPTGWLFCNGACVSRTTYAALFTAIGTTYGVCDGSTTFGLPNTTNRVIAGAQEDSGGVPKSDMGNGLEQTGGGTSHSHQVQGSNLDSLKATSLFSQETVVGPDTSAMTGFVSDTTNTDSASSVPPFLSIPKIIKT